MPMPDRRLRQDELGALLGRAFEPVRSSEPPRAIYRSVRRRIASPPPARPRERRPERAVDWWTAAPWPSGLYSAQLVTWAAVPLRTGLASW